LMAKGFTIRNQKLQVARIRTIHVRIVNLIDNAMAKREPNPASRVVGRSDPLLGRARPTRFDPGRAECLRFRDTHGLPMNSLPIVLVLVLVLVMGPDDLPFAICHSSFPGPFRIPMRAAES